MPVSPTPEVEVIWDVKGKTFTLNGMPEELWLSFQAAMLKHFPNDGEDAWAKGLTEFIIMAGAGTSYILTDVPEANARALSDTLQRVGWSWEQLTSYMLHSAVRPGALRIMAFNEPEGKPPQLGTLIITGLRKSTFDKLEKHVGVSTEDFFSLMVKGIENGTIKFTPENAFIEASRPERDSDTISNSES